MSLISTDLPRQFKVSCKLASAGARLAEPGEFTYRAFMNGRLDLTQAGGVLDTVESLTRNQLNQATRLRMGSFNEHIRQIRDACFGVLAMVEASVDFSDEIGVLDRAEALSRLHPVQKELQALITSQGHSQLVRDGFTLAILGRPNVGKSSLLNALLQSDRAIVTPIAGTTRDTVEDWLEVDGMMIRIIDTAGLRTASDVVEQIGIKRALEAAHNANLIWFLYDLSEGWTEKDEDEMRKINAPVVRVGNKADVAPSGTEEIVVSAKTGIGIPALLAHLRTQIGDSEATSGVNVRHLPLLEQAHVAIREAIRTFSSETPDDLASVLLRDAVFSLGQITGDTASEDMIQRIFRDFCIGK